MRRGRGGISKVIGDKYAGEWPRERFRVHGIDYETGEMNRSELYTELLPLINAGRCSLLDSDRLIAQLVSLERRTTRVGKDSIDHPPGGHDDVANAVAGAIVHAVTLSGRTGRTLYFCTVGLNDSGPTYVNQSYGDGCLDPIRPTIEQDPTFCSWKHQQKRDRYLNHDPQNPVPTCECQVCLPAWRAIKARERV
jgi:hypothetical protein